MVNWWISGKFLVKCAVRFRFEAKWKRNLFVLKRKNVLFLASKRTSKWWETKRSETNEVKNWKRKEAGSEMKRKEETYRCIKLPYIHNRTPVLKWVVQRKPMLYSFLFSSALGLFWLGSVNWQHKRQIEHKWKFREKIKAGAKKVKTFSAVYLNKY